MIWTGLDMAELPPLSVAIGSKARRPGPRSRPRQPEGDLRCGPDQRGSVEEIDAGHEAVDVGDVRFDGDRGAGDEG